MELGDAERLREVVIGAGIEGGHLVPFLVSRREHEDRRRAIGPDPMDHGEPADPRETQVDDHQVRPSLFPSKQRGFTVGCLRHVIPAGAEVGGDHPSCRLVILDEQDLGTIRRRHQPASGSVGAAGTRMMIASPPSSLADAWTVPPVASTRPRTTVNPSPTPRREPVAAPGAR